MQCCFTDIKQVKSRFFSRNHRHEARETGDFPHLSLHGGLQLKLGWPGEPCAAQPGGGVGVIKAAITAPASKGARSPVLPVRLGLPPPALTTHGPFAAWV